MVRWLWSETERWVEPGQQTGAGYQETRNSISEPEKQQNGDLDITVGVVWGGGM